MDIDKLSKMSDADLMGVMGLTAKLETAKAAIAKLGTLEGEARTKAEARIKEMFTPSVWPSELNHIYEDATRTPEDCHKDCSPCSVM